MFHTSPCISLGNPGTSGFAEKLGSPSWSAHTTPLTPMAEGLSGSDCPGLNSSRTAVGPRWAAARPPGGTTPDTGNYSPGGTPPDAHSPPPAPRPSATSVGSYPLAPAP